ncbi:sodium-dependent glucose transporter 1-like [Mya arenaria]|uniref:sodium-dependent glucose transporter 1-like n=1 Tax=Mya arenaria TaxID=6604 RepID=UPI0022E39FF7|nr:sodium-dependent glucose transporter 1-like [Mya arenaria]
MEKDRLSSDVLESGQNGVSFKYSLDATSGEENISSASATEGEELVADAKDETNEKEKHFNNDQKETGAIANGEEHIAERHDQDKVNVLEETTDNNNMDGVELEKDSSRETLDDDHDKPYDANTVKIVIGHSRHSRTHHDDHAHSKHKKHRHPFDVFTVLLKRLKKDSEYRIRFLHTLFVIWMFITLGWVVSVVGSTFPDLRLIINKDLDTASWIFTGGSIGYMTGAFVFGLLFDRLNRMLVMVAVTTLSGFAIAVMPWCSTFPWLVVINVVSGFFTGGIDVCGNSHIASIWGVQAAPYMQSIHFGFSAGGFIGPQTAKPFVAPVTCVPTNETYNNTTEKTCVDIYGETHIHWTYLIVGIGSLSAAVPFLILYCLSGSHNTYITTFMENNELSKKNIPITLPDLSLKKKVLFVSALTLLISSYACTEGRYSSLITSFNDEYLKWPKQEGLDLASVFWGAFAVGRFISIPISHYLKPSNMILVYLIVLTLTFIAFLFASIHDIVGLIWTCSALAGLSMSAIFPAIFTWTAESILHVTGKISATYLVGVSVFNMLMPLLYGYLMEHVNLLYFAYLLIAQCVFSFVIYVIIRLMIKLYIQPVTLENEKDKV